MSASPKISGWATEAAAALADAGHRRGGARTAIIELLDEQRCALSAAEIEEQLQRRGREASRASIYRVMEELESIGLLARVEVGQGTTRFEPARGSAGHHHHLVCERCGRLEPFSDDGLELAIERVSERLALEVSEHEIVLRGACRSCAA
jgi:Fur family ferric uptake transcriptional regulator